MEFLGRDAELAAVARCLEQAAGGQGSIVLVHGEAGIGKTRFLQRVSELAAERQATVASGRWYESPDVPAYVGFLEAIWQLLSLGEGRLRSSLDPSNPHVRELARLGPEIAVTLGLEAPEPAAGDPEQYGLWRGVVTLLEAACKDGLVVLVLDDLQWADSGSLDLFSFIGRNIAGLPLVVLAAYREEAVTPERPLGDSLSALQGGKVEELELSGLGLQDVRLLAESTVGGPVDESTAKKVQDLTNGNPLFVEEMSRRLASAMDNAEGIAPRRLEDILRTDLPKSIRTFMAERFDSLSAETQYLLQLAACFGRNFDILLIEEIADLEGPALTAILEEALDAAVVTETEPGQFAFTHPLMREVTYAAIAPANRIAIHEHVASAIEKHYGTIASRHSREIANHLLSAGELADPAKTVRYCTMGAHQARALFASEEMLRLTQGTLAALERLPLRTPRLRARLLLDHAYAETMLGHPDAALALYEQALRVYRELDDEEGETDCHRWMATTLLRCGRFDEAAALIEDALARAPERRTHAYVALAGAHALAALVTGRFQEAGTWTGKLLDLAFDAETRAIAHHAAAGHCSWGVGDPSAALQHFEECRANFLEVGNDGTAAQVAADQTRGRVPPGPCRSLSRDVRRMHGASRANEPHYCSCRAECLHRCHKDS